VNNLATRSLTAVFFVVIMVGSVLLGQTVFSILLLGITYLSISEFVTIISAEKVQPSSGLTISAGMLTYSLLAAHALGFIAIEWLTLIFPTIFVVFAAELWRNKKNPFSNIAVSLLGIIYIGVPFGLVIYFFNSISMVGPLHYGITLGYLLLLWLNDTGAYLVGSMVGKHKLFERISPGKTWEGSAGGALFALATGWGLSMIFIQLTTLQWLILAIIVVITGTLGDLVESMLKRSLGIKDSGNILPGHGGMLDRFDAVLISAPFVFVYLALFCR